MRRYGYDSYHGRSRLRTFLKLLIVLLLAILIVAVAAFFLLEKYMVYDSNGPHLELPFWQGSGTTPTPEPQASLPIIVVTPEPTPTPTPEPAALHAVLLPRSALYDGTAQAQVGAAAGNAALFDMKAHDGTLGYISNLELAVSAGASAADPALNAAIQALNEGELYTIARVSCFRDNLTPKQQNKLAIKTNSGYNWRDQDEIRWLSPTNETVRQYLADICAELAGLGFDEILLDYCGYPTEGTLKYIKKGAAYDSTQFEPIITAFYAQVRQAISAYPEVKLSVVTDLETLTTGANATSGQSLAGLLQSTDRIWTSLEGTSWQACTGLLSGAGMQEPEAGLVAIISQAGPGTEGWAVWPGR